MVTSTARFLNSLIALIIWIEWYRFSHLILTFFNTVPFLNIRHIVKFQTSISNTILFRQDHMRFHVSFNIFWNRTFKVNCSCLSILCTVLRYLTVLLLFQSIYKGLLLFLPFSSFLVRAILLYLSLKFLSALSAIEYSMLSVFQC